MNVYIHIPFCRNKCGYCVFYSKTAPSEVEIDRYLDTLEAELRVCEECETVYIGGGTPTLLSEFQLERLLRIIPSASEISIESNPETLTKGKVEILRSFVTRLSLGVQSFDPGIRETLGRDCSQDALERALFLISAARFPHWNCDLIYAVPGQSAAGFRKDLETAAALGVDHLSCYSLTAEEGARLSDIEVDDEAGASMWHEAGEVLRRFGFRRYEISNYARPGGECRHNVNVWRGGLLRGFGPTAAGFDGRVRLINPVGEGEPEVDELPVGKRLNEIFAVNLRTADGWSPELWGKVPRADAWKQRLAIAAGIDSEWIEIDADRIALTEEGLLFWDSVAEQLL